MEDIGGEGVLCPILLPGNGQNQLWLQIPQETPSCGIAPARAAERAMIVSYQCADCKEILDASRLPVGELDSLASRITLSSECGEPHQLRSREESLRCDRCIMQHLIYTGRKQTVSAFHECIQRGMFDVSWTLSARVTTAGNAAPQELLQQSIQYNSAEQHHQKRKDLIDSLYKKLHDRILPDGTFRMEAAPEGDGSA